MYLLFYVVFILYEEVLYKLLAANNFQLSVINSIFYYVAIAGLLSFITYLLPKKIGKHFFRIITFILTFWYGACIIVKKTFNITLSISATSMADQFTGGGFLSLALSVLKNNWKNIVLIIIPFVLCILISIFYNRKQYKFTKLIKYIVITAVSFGLFICSLYFKPESDLGTLYFKQRNNDSNVEYFGVLPSLFIDVRKQITGFEEEIVIIEEEEPIIEEVEQEEKFVSQKQILDIDFDSLSLIESNTTIQKMHQFFKSESPTYTSEYTGLYEGKNLIYIMAESFDGYMVTEELTPTLYKMVHEGLDFTNYYSNTNLSTIGGEFMELTGLMPDLSMLSYVWREGNGHRNYYEYGLGNVFANLDYHTYAYHNHTYTFQNRNLYLDANGFSNYLGCGNGIENKNVTCYLVNNYDFPESDLEMIEGTYKDYIYDDHFMVYYATVSGHMGWDFKDNVMAIKHKDEVRNLPYSESVKAFIAANLELEDAMTRLLEILEENGKLEDTVIVLAADHHPYGLSFEEMQELATIQNKEIDETFEIYHNNLIIYNAGQEHVEIDTPCSTIDILPTTLNLFNIPFDSRIIIGKDILSPTGNGLVIFSDDSWISKYAKYDAGIGKATKLDPNDTMNLQGHVTLINNRVSNRLWASRNIMNYDYYRIIFQQD